MRIVNLGPFMPIRFPSAVLLAAACLGTAPASAQTLAEWLGPVDGDWSNPLNWSTPAVPDNGGGTTYDVLISAGGGAPYSVTLDNLTVAVDSLILNDANATLRLVRSDLTLGVMDVMAGSIVTNGSTIRDVQLTSTGSSAPIQWDVSVSPFSSPSTTLDNVRVSSDVTFSSSDYTGMTIQNGLLLDDGVVVRSELLGRISMHGDLTTTGHATLQISGEMYMPGGVSSVQIGSGFTLEMLGGDALLENYIDNYGTIRADGAGNAGDVEAVNNYGLIEAVNGGLVVLSTVAQNHGTLHADTGSTLRIELGQLTMHAGSQLTGEGRFNLRSGGFDLNGQSIDLDLVNFTMDGGRLSNGTITGTGGTPLTYAITQFSNDLYWSQMIFETDVHLADWGVTIEDGLTLTNGAVIENAPGSSQLRLDFSDAMTISGDGRIRFGSGLAVIAFEQSSGAVIFDTGIFIDALQGDGIIGTGDKDWINRGTIALGTGHSLTFRGNWSNEGTLIVEDSAELILGGEFATADFGTVINQGGTIVIEGNLDNQGSVLDLLLVPGHVKIDNGSIIGGTVQSSGSSVLDFGRYATFHRVVLDTESTNARYIRVEEYLTLNEDLEITAGSVGFGNNAGIYTRDDSGDGTTHLGGNGVITFRTNPDPSLGFGAGISADHSETLEIGADLTILQDVDGTLVFIGGPESSLVNAGTLDFRHGDTHIDGQWTNQGVIQLSNNANVLLLGEYTTADLLSIDYQGGDLRIAGTLDNSGAVLLKDADTAWLIVNQTTHSAHPGDGVNILGGRVETGDGQSFRNVASLDGVTLAGDVWLGDRNDGTIFNGLVFDGGTLHIVDNSNSLFSGLFTGTGMIQFDAGRFQPPILRFNNTSNPFGSDITVQVGDSNGTVGDSSYIWTNEATLRSFNPGLDLRIEGDVTHNGSAHAEDGGSITFANLTNHGTLIAERGGTLRLEDGWTNPTGQIDIVDGGILAVSDWSATPGLVVLDAGVIRVEIDTDLAGLAVFPQQGGSFLDLAGELNLGGAALDLDSFTSTLRLDGGTLLDGKVVGSQPLLITNAVSPASVLDGIQVLVDVQLGNTGTTYLRNATSFVGSTMTGGGTLLIEPGDNIVFDGTTVDAQVVIDRGATMAVTNGLVLEGQIGSGAGGGAVPRLLLDGPQALGGEGQIVAATSAGLRVEFTGDLTLGPDLTLAATGGSLILAGGEQVLDLQGTLSVGFSRSASMTVGQWDNHGSTIINASASLLVNATTIMNHGVIDLRNGLLNTGGTDVANADTATIVGRGDINLGGTGTLHQSGTLEIIEASDARLRIIGDLSTQSSATIQITYHNSHSSNLPYLRVTGDAELDGDLVLVSESLTFVESGDTQLLVLADTLGGSFTSVTGLGIDAQFSWHLDYQADRLTAVARLSGDIDDDGSVGISDLDFLLAHWGSTTTPGNTLAGEWSGDGTVGADDLQIVLDHWGNATPPEDNVPEPGTLAPLALAGLASARRRRVNAR